MKLKEYVKNHLFAAMATGIEELDFVIHLDEQGEVVRDSGITVRFSVRVSDYVSHGEKEES